MFLFGLEKIPGIEAAVRVITTQLAELRESNERIIRGRVEQVQLTNPPGVVDLEGLVVLVTERVRARLGIDSQALATITDRVYRDVDYDAIDDKIVDRIHARVLANLDQRALIGALAELIWENDEYDLDEINEGIAALLADRVEIKSPKAKPRPRALGIYRRKFPQY